MFQEKYERELERFCNFKKEIPTLKEAIQKKGYELDKLRFKLYTMTNAEETSSNSNKKKQEKRDQRIYQQQRRSYNDA